LGFQLHRQVSKTRYGCSFRRVLYNFNRPTTITPTATATKKPPKNEPTSNVRCEPVVVVVTTVVIGNSDAVETFPSAGRPHTTEKR